MGVLMRSVLFDLINEGFLENDKREKEEVWHCPMTKAPLPTANS